MTTALNPSNKLSTLRVDAAGNLLVTSASPAVGTITRGTISMGSGINTGTSTVTAPDPSKARLTLLGASINNAGAAPADVGVRLTLTANTITANRGGVNYTLVVDWQLEVFP